MALRATVNCVKCAERRPRQLELPVYFPSPHLSTDNAAMIAAAGTVKLLAGERGSLDMNADVTLRLQNLDLGRRSGETMRGEISRLAEYMVRSSGNAEVLPDCSVELAGFNFDESTIEVRRSIENSLNPQFCGSRHARPDVGLINPLSCSSQSRHVFHMPQLLRCFSFPPPSKTASVKFGSALYQSKLEKYFCSQGSLNTLPWRA